MTRRAVSASVTVPAPSRKPSGIVGARSAISSTAPGTVIVTSSAVRPPSDNASTTARSRLRFLDSDDGDDPGALDGGGD